MGHLSIHQAMMKAVRVNQFGGLEALATEEVERPVAGPGEVLVRVKAAGVGPWDAWVRSGQSAVPQPLPLTLGSDLAGVIEAVGEGVEQFAVGDEIYGVTNPRFVGAQAEFAVASAGMIAVKPRKLNFVRAASVPVVAVTAFQMLFEHAALSKGQTVLIHGAAGNVGSYAVQMAHQAGLWVIATANGRDADYVRSLGADQVIDYRAARFEEIAGPVDAVIDLVGGEVQERSFAVVKRGGVLVSAVSAPDGDLAQRSGVRAFFMLVEVNRARLERIGKMLDAGDLQPRVGVILPLSKIRDAHEMLAGNREHPQGKIVLKI